MYVFFYCWWANSIVKSLRAYGMWMLKNWFLYFVFKFVLKFWYGKEIEPCDLNLSNALYLFWLYFILCVHRVFAIEIFTLFILLLLFVFTWKIGVLYFRTYVSVRFLCTINFHRNFSIFWFTLGHKFHYFGYLFGYWWVALY